MLPALLEARAQPRSSVPSGLRQGFCSQAAQGHRPVVYVGFMALWGLELQSVGCGAGASPQSSPLRAFSNVLKNSPTGRAAAASFIHGSQLLTSTFRVVSPPSLMVPVDPDRHKYKNRKQMSGSCV